MPIEKRWVVRPQGDPRAVEQLASLLGMSPVLANLLVQRGIDTVEKAKKFFTPQLSDLHDPFLMKDMDRAVERVEQAVRNHEKVMIYGDYDVDGTTAVSLVYKFLSQIGHKNLSFYIPDRYVDGYGISIRSIDHAVRKGVKLVIALDCGIKAVEKVAYAKERGVDFIICDHHLPADEIPAAVAVLDPKRTDCNYPFDELSGCGVGFKLVEAYARKNRIPFSKIEHLLDLLVVSIASDIVPLVDENRILAYYGLRKLNSTPSKGLLSIIKICGLEGHDITIDDIVFKIGPRINASGRMQSGREAVELLVSRDVNEAYELGKAIDQYNKDRKELDKRITDEANDILESRGEMVSSKKSIVIYNKDWHKGIIGIVASRLTELYYKPSVVLTLANGLATGSSRSVQGFDIYKAIDASRDLLENFGGHPYAVGLSLKEENIPEFTRRFEEYVKEHIQPEQLQPLLDIDAFITFSEITPAFISTLRRFNPFGPGNNKPVFCTRNVMDFGTSKLVGKNLEHIKFELVDDTSGKVFNGIAFNMAEHFPYVHARKPFDICFTIEDNKHQSATSSIQLLVKSIHPKK